MAIEWLQESRAEQLFHDTLLNWAQDYAYAGCYSPGETQAYVDSFFTAGYSQSPTATALKQFIERSARTIYVLGMRGGFQCFNSTEGPDKDMPVIFIDVDGKLEIFVRSPHGMQMKFGPEPKELERTERRALNYAATVAAREVFHGDRLKKAPWVGKRVSLDNRIAALHEFGHAKQYLERPHLFDPQNRKAQALDEEGLARSLRSAVKGSRAENLNVALRHRIEQQFGGLGEQADPRLEPDKFAKTINAAAIKMATKANQPKSPAPGPAVLPIAPAVTASGGSGAPPPPLTVRKAAAPLAAQVPPPLHLATKADLDEVADQRRATGNWGRVIEMDNMARHEWPICREIGVLYRTNYRDLDATTTAEASLTNQIIREAKALETH